MMPYPRAPESILPISGRGYGLNPHVLVDPEVVFCEIVPLGPGGERFSAQIRKFWGWASFVQVCASSVR